MNLRIAYVSLIISLLLMVSCNDNSKIESTIDEAVANPTNKTVLSSEIVFEKLNPARGDQSPQAGTIWGDRKGKIPTGFLARFVDGFSSPPHIHNVTYRAVVIKGLIHNDDPEAENMWMPQGSFWTQPVGESHITSSKGESIALVEIDEGPYLVKPIEKAFDSGERPINIDVNNIVWLKSDRSDWVSKKSNTKISFLWEDKNNSKGLFVKLPKGYSGTIKTDGTVLHSVVTKGKIKYILPQNQETKILDEGSYFGATTEAIHNISNNSQNEVIIYVKTNGNIKVE